MLHHRLHLFSLEVTKGPYQSHILSLVCSGQETVLDNLCLCRTDRNLLVLQAFTGLILRLASEATYMLPPYARILSDTFVLKVKSKAIPVTGSQMAVRLSALRTSRCFTPQKYSFYASGTHFC
jgi:hypothetical protein